MPVDAAGIKRAGAFTTVRDAASGLTFTPIGGTGTRIRYRVSGNGANGTIDVNNAYVDGASLAYAAYNAGVAKPPRTTSLDSIAARHW